MRRLKWWIVVPVVLADVTALHYGFGWEFCDARRCPHRYKTWTRDQIVSAAGLRRDPRRLAGHYVFHGCRVPVLLGTKSDVDAYEDEGVTVARNADGTAGFEVEGATAASRRCKRAGDAALRKLH